MSIALVSAALLATAAGAEPMVVIDGDARSVVRIAHDDLNLGSKRGRDRLNARVIAAVRSMCHNDKRDMLTIELSEQRCYARSIQDAGYQIDRAFTARRLGFAGQSAAIAISRR